MNIVFPSGILLTSNHSFLPIFFQKLELVLSVYNPLWGNGLVNLLFLFLLLVSLDTEIDSCPLPYFVFFQRPQLEKVRKKVADEGSWGSGGWLSLEDIFIGFLVGCLGLSILSPHSAPFAPQTCFGHMAKLLYFSPSSSLPFHFIYISPVHFQTSDICCLLKLFQSFPSDNVSWLQLAG